MQSKVATVSEYLKSLPKDRRIALEAVRKVILANLDKDLEEGMQYGMIGYFVPHSVFPAGYHCDPNQPLCYAGLASQKNYMSLYLMTVYGHPETERAFKAAWVKSGKKLDMGKACLRFKDVEDLALDVIGSTIKRVSAKAYVANYLALLDQRGSKHGTKPAAQKKKPAAGAKKSAAPKKPRAKG